MNNKYIIKIVYCFEQLINEQNLDICILNYNIQIMKRVLTSNK